MPAIVGRFIPPRLASAPSAPTGGEIYFDTGTNTLLWWNGTAWVSGINMFRMGHTWAIGGALAAGANVPQIFIPKLAGQTTTLVGVRAVIGTGTSIGVQVQRNGSNLGSVVTVTTTAATTAYSQAMADTDTLDIVLSAPVGSPADLSFTAILEHTV